MAPRNPDAAKKPLRAAALAARRGLSPPARTRASAAVCRRLLALPELAGAATVAAFAPAPDEVDIRPVLAKWLRAGRSVLVPRVVRGTRKMTWHKISDLKRDLNTGYAGLSEPEPKIPESDPAAAACVLIPSVAVDRGGRRIGFGGGFYDTNSPRLDARVFLVAPVFSCQLISACPARAPECMLDAIVTEREVVRCR